MTVHNSAQAYSSLSWLTPAIQKLPPTSDAQTAGDLAALNLTGLHLLHLNELPYPPSPRAIEAAIASTADLHRYPAVRGQPLADALAKRTGIMPHRIIIGSGSGELILFSCHVTLSPGDHAVGPAPSFPGYTHAIGCSAERSFARNSIVMVLRMPAPSPPPSPIRPAWSFAVRRTRPAAG